MDLEPGGIVDEFFRDAKDAGQANVFVEIGPPDGCSEGSDLPMCTLRGGGIPEAWESLQRHTNLPAVAK